MGGLGDGLEGMKWEEKSGYQVNGILSEVGKRSIFPSLRPGMSLPPPRPLAVPQARKGSPTGTVAEL